MPSLQSAAGAAHLSPSSAQASAAHIAKRSMPSSPRTSASLDSDAWVTPPSSPLQYKSDDSIAPAAIEDDVELLPAPLRPWSMSAIPVHPESKKIVAERVYGQNHPVMRKPAAAPPQAGSFADSPAGPSQARKDSQGIDEHLKVSEEYMDSVLKNINFQLDNALEKFKDLAGAFDAARSIALPMPPRFRTEWTRFEIESDDESDKSSVYSSVSSSAPGRAVRRFLSERDSFIRQGLSLDVHILQPSHSIARAAAAERRRQDMLNGRSNVQLTALPQVQTQSPTSQPQEKSETGFIPRWLSKRKSSFFGLRSAAQEPKEATADPHRTLKPSASVSSMSLAAQESSGEALPAQKLRRRASVFNLFAATQEASEATIPDYGQRENGTACQEGNATYTLKTRKSLLRPASWFMKTDTS